MALLDKRLYDGAADLSGGVDGGRRPDTLNANQCAKAENVQFRSGAASSRLPFADLVHTFANDVFYLPSGFLDIQSLGGLNSTSTQEAFEDGVFQCAHYYAPPNGPESIVASIGGRVMQIAIRQNRSIRVTEKPLPARNNSLSRIAYMTQADRFLIVQDGESAAIVLDGTVVTRSSAADDGIPVGTIMAYGMGRLVVVDPKRHDLVFGDLYGSHLDLPNWGDSVIKFSETKFLDEGGSASVSAVHGKVEGLIFVPQQDSVTGDGELMALTERGAIGFYISLPRDKWKQSAFQRVTLLNEGGRGSRMVVSVNGDVWFRSQDGFRSYRQARAEIQGWARLPMSTEIREWTESDTERMLEYGSMIHFDNRMISTCTPQSNGNRTYHLGLLALDFDVLSSFGSASRPSWDGHWTKLRITQLVSGMFNGEERAFAFAIAANGKNHLYELMKEGIDDWDAPITSSLTGRSLTFNSPMDEKELIGGDIWVTGVAKTTTITISYRPDQAPAFATWKTLAAIAATGTCGAINCGGCPTIVAGYYPRRTIGKPPDACDSMTNRSLRRGFEFQPRLSWTGKATIRKFRLHAKPIIEKTHADC